MPKKIKLELNVNPNSLYLNGSKPSIGFCTKITNGEVKQLDDFHTCRETLVARFRQFIRATMIPGSSNKSTELKWSMKKIPTDKARLIFLIRVDSRSKSISLKHKELFSKAVRQGVKIANLIEENAGWSKTKLYPVEITKWPEYSVVNYDEPRSLNNKEKVNASLTAFVVEGTIRWFNSPYLLSLWSLIIRAGRFTAIARIRTYKGLISKLTTIRRDHVLSLKIPKEGKKCVGPDVNLILQSFGIWAILTKHYSTIFKGRKIQDNYSKDSMKGPYAGSEGVHMLSQGKGSDQLIKKRIKKICDEEKIVLDIYNKTG